MYTDVQIGNTLRNLRINKGFSLENLCQGDMSRSFLSKVERGSSKISLDKFLLILDRLHISMEEFLFILRGNERDEKTKFMGEIQIHFAEKNLVKLEEIMERLEYENADFEQKILTISFISHLKKEELPNRYYKQLMDYLFSVEEWGIHEIKLFGNAINCLSLDNLIIHGREILKNKQAFMKNDQLYVAFISMLLNIIEKSLQSEEIGIAEYFINELDQIHIVENLVVERLILDFNKKYITWKKDGTESSYKECKKMIDLMLEIKLIRIAKDLENLIVN